MWSYLATRFFINPLPGYVENKAVFGESFNARRNDPSARAFGSDIPGALGEQGIPRRQSGVLGRYFPSAVIFDNASP
jgi:hypothetical protein